VEAGQGESSPTSRASRRFASARFFAELKRRNVLRAGVLYIGAAWALAQGIAQLGPAFGMPDWGTRWFVIACCIGFPLWIAFAWFYEFTPQGLKRESEVAPGDSITHSTGRKLDFWIIGVLAAAVVLLVTNQFVLRRDATSVANRVDASTAAAELAKVPAKSVAVLPFANESGDPKQQYFSDGLSEELITSLTQLADLKVIGKYSSFRFRDSKDSPAQIGAALGVANLVTGSVRQQGEVLRITATLIHASDGSALWSQAYDRPLKDVFAIQSEIGQAVAGALKIKLLGTSLEDRQKPPSGNVEAYQLMLQGRAQARRQTRTDYQQAIALLERAVQLDPDYAYAWAVLAQSRLGFATWSLGGAERQRMLDDARTALERTTALAPGTAFMHRTRSNFLDYLEHDQAGALEEARKALAIAPNDSTTIYWVANKSAAAGQPQAALSLFRKAIAGDPLRADWYGMMANALQQLGRFAAADEAMRKQLSLQPDNPGNHAMLAAALAAHGDFDGAKQVARKAAAMAPDDPSNHLQLALTLDAAGQLPAAEQAARKALALNADYPGTHALLSAFAIERGDAVAALREAGQETDPDLKAAALALALQLGNDRAAADAALKAYIDQYGKTAPYSVAELYAVRRQPDDMFQWLERGAAQYDLTMMLTLYGDPLLRPYHGDPRFAAFCRKVGLPVPGDAAAANAASSV
jgi:TolB-like protein/tetratricopeptide (TPR) repeat protein